MSMKHGLWIATVATLVFVSCAPSGTEEAVPVESETIVEDTGPDPTVVDAGHYTAELENDRVRIVRIKYGPGEESVMHYHPEAVGVYLTDADVEMTFPDGSTESLQMSAGEHGFYPAGQHLPRNVGDQPLELVLIELEDGALGAPPEGDDPTVVDADHYTAEFENELVRVVRIAYGPGEESVMHYHPDGVAVFLTDHDVQMTLADGTTSEVVADAGEALYVPAGPHRPKNVSDGAWELVLVELK